MPRLIELNEIRVKRLRLLMLAVFASLVCGYCIYAISAQSCYARERYDPDTPPTIAGSILLNDPSPTELFPDSHYITFLFHADVSLEEFIAYYEEIGLTCIRDVQCRGGKSGAFATYRAYLPADAPSLESGIVYALEVSWETCGDGRDP
jgi:hypothetical protein